MAPVRARQEQAGRQDRLGPHHTFNREGSYRYTFKPACESNGLAGLILRTVRHITGALALESRAFDRDELYRAMGHSSCAITG